MSISTATENAIAEHDGWVGDFGMNNFYLYQFGNSTRFQVIPWDKDTAFTATQWPVGYHLDKNVLTRRLTADPAKLRGCDFIIVAVPTPIDVANRPDLKILGSASRIVGENAGRFGSLSTDRNEARRFAGAAAPSGPATVSRVMDRPSRSSKPF